MCSKANGETLSNGLSANGTGLPGDLGGAASEALNDNAANSGSEASKGTTCRASLHDYSNCSLPDGVKLQSAGVQPSHRADSNVMTWNPVLLICEMAEQQSDDFSVEMDGGRSPSSLHYMYMLSTCRVHDFFGEYLCSSVCTLFCL